MEFRDSSFQGISFDRGTGSRREDIDSRLYF